MNKKELTIELIPSSTFYNNARNNISEIIWNKIRIQCYKKAKYKCEICGETGIEQSYEHKLECHEIWMFDDKEHIQRLIGLTCLCVLCHKVKHFGLSKLNGEEKIAIEHLMKVNNITKDQANFIISRAFNQWKKRSEHEWKLDISYLNQYLNNINKIKNDRNSKNKQ